MPLPLLGAAAGLAGGILNSQSQAQQNQASMRFSEAMYERQKRDNIDFWNMQNAYNSPQSQMNRFQEAGLNPHLIYGQGNSGNSGSISTPDVQAPQFRSPEWGNGVSVAGLTYMNAVYDLEIKQAQAKNLETQNTVLHQERLLKEAQTFATQTGGFAAEFKLDFDRELRGVSGDTARERLRQLKTSTDISINQDARNAALNASNVEEAAQRMISMKLQRVNTRAEAARIRAATSGIARDNTLKDLDIELRRQGINPNDPMWARIVGRILEGLYDRYVR